MKRIVCSLLLAGFAAVTFAQTSSKATPAVTATHKSTPPASAPAAKATTAVAPWIKLPPGVPKVAHGLVKVPFSLRYEEIAVGTGPVGEAGKVWHLKYTGWRAADGVKFDSWVDHKQISIGKDGKPEFGPDGKPKMGEPQPLLIPQGMGRVIPGFDWGLDGMRIGGKRRIFIPWQLAYGTHEIADRPDHPGIPAKSDLIFDVELVEVSEMPAPPQRPMAPGVPPHPGASAAPGAAPTAPATTATTPVPATQPAANPQTTAPAQPQPK